MENAQRALRRSRYANDLRLENVPDWMDVMGLVDMSIYVREGVG